MEPSVAPVTFVQQPAAAPNAYNNSQRYTSQYDPYYNLYDDEVEIYRDVGKSEHCNHAHFVKIGIRNHRQRKVPKYG